MPTHRKNAKNADGTRKRRGNGSGTLMLQKGTYYALWYVQQMDGTRKRICRTTGESDLEKAREKLEKFTVDFGLRDTISRDNADRAALAERLKSAQLTIEADAEKLAKQRKAALDALPALPISHSWIAYKHSANRPDTGERTLADYEGYIGALEDWLSAHFPKVKELRQITRTEAEAYAAYLRANRSAGTFNKRIVFFRHFWRVLSDDTGKNPQAKEPDALPAKLIINPWEKIQKRETETHTRRELTIEELARVCSSLSGEMRLLFALGIYTGLRLGDCALLDWGAIDLARGHISTIPRKTKRHSNGKPVVIPLHPALLEMLLEIDADRRTGYLLPEIAATYSRESSILTNRIQKHFRACGIKTSTEQGKGRRAQTDVGFHSLRHTFVSLSANAGTPMAVVQSIVGHSNPAMTRHYYHESDTALKGAVAALPNVITIDAQTIADAAQTETRRDTSATDGDALDTFKAAFAALDAEQQKTALKWANNNRKA